MDRYLVYRKVASSRLSQLVAHFHIVYEGEFWCLCIVTFGQNGPKLNSGPVYCSRLYGTYIHSGSLISFLKEDNFEFKNFFRSLRYTIMFNHIISFKPFKCTPLDYTLVPLSYATPIYTIFAATLFWIGSKKTWVKLFSSKLRYFFPPVTLFSSFSPQLRCSNVSLLCLLQINMHLCLWPLCINFGRYKSELTKLFWWLICTFLR